MRLTAAVLLVLLIGCGSLDSSSDPELVLRADETEYQPGDTVALTLLNRSTRSFLIHPSLCPVILQRFENFAWNRVMNGEHLACTLEALHLPPDGVARTRVPLRSTLQPGEYRFRYDVEIRDRNWSERYRRFERIEVSAAVFQVVENP